MEKALDLSWHPFTSLASQGHEIKVKKAKGAYLYTEQGKIFDAISSWWVNIHGHSHPYLLKNMQEQYKRFDHVMFAGFTHDPAIALSQRLLKLLNDYYKRVFYSDNGSTAVEVSIKMAMQYWYNLGDKKRKYILSFKEAYHGDTFGAMSVSDSGTFTDPFSSYMFQTIKITPPMLGQEEKSFDELNKILKKNKDKISFFIFEPLVQGTAGMKMHSKKGLDEILRILKSQNILTIADEVMTGFGRTGRLFATDYLKNKPNIICFSKAITGGVLPLGVTLMDQQVLDAFQSPEKQKTFFHGHSYTANPLALACAHGSLDLLEKDETWKNIKMIASSHQKFIQRLKKEFKGKVSQANCLGTIASFEVLTNEKTHYLNSIRDKIYSFFIQKGQLIRPLGNIIYLIPPYCSSQKDLESIYNDIYSFLSEL